MSPLLSSTHIRVYVGLNRPIFFFSKKMSLSRDKASELSQVERSPTCIGADAGDRDKRKDKHRKKREKKRNINFCSMIRLRLILPLSFSGLHRISARTLPRQLRGSAPLRRGIRLCDDELALGHTCVCVSLLSVNTLVSVNVSGRTNDDNVSVMITSSRHHDDDDIIFSQEI